MFDLNSGELFVVVFILIAIVSAPVWPALGEWLVARLSRRSDRKDSDRG
jgi:hypothetical protein